MSRRKNTVIVPAILLAGSIVFAGEGTSSDGRIKIETSYVRPSAELNYCRTCCHAPNGTFTVDVVSAPQPKHEWRLESELPEYRWTIFPNVAGTVSGEYSRTFSVNLLDADFPKSYTVRVEVTWGLTNDSGEHDTSTADATFEFDAIEYSYSVRPAVEIDGRGDGALVDSHPGKISITAMPCRHSELLSMKFSASPVSETWQNEVGSTEMGFVGADNALTRVVPCPYWYAKGGSSPQCCYSNLAEYNFVLEADGCGGHAKRVNVYLPMDDHESRMSPQITIAKIIVKNRRVNNAGDLVLTLRVVNYVVRAIAISHGSSQYRDKIFKEEKIHASQIKREQGFGFEDLYSISDALEGFGIAMGVNVPEKTVEMTFASEDEATSDIEEMQGYIVAESEISGLLWDENEAYSEFDAKHRADFHEAYLYHCCYEKKFGPTPHKVSKSEVICKYYKSKNED